MEKRNGSRERRSLLAQHKRRDVAQAHEKGKEEGRNAILRKNVAALQSELQSCKSELECQRGDREVAKLQTRFSRSKTSSVAKPRLARKSAVSTKLLSNLRAAKLTIGERRRRRVRSTTTFSWMKLKSAAQNPPSRRQQPKDSFRGGEDLDQATGDSSTACRNSLSRNGASFKTRDPPCAKNSNAPSRRPSRSNRRSTNEARKASSCRKNSNLCVLPRKPRSSQCRHPSSKP